MHRVAGGMADAGNAFWLQAATYANLADLATAALAIVPGAIDLFGGVPAGSHARDTGMKHLSLHLVSTAMFAISAYLLWTAPLTRAAGASVDARTPLVFAAIGELFLLAAGWFGWNLVQRHHVGVEAALPRTDPPSYADDETDELDDRVTLPRPAIGHDVLPRPNVDAPRYKH